METDRTEMNDLAKARPELAKTMAEEWERWAKMTGVKFK